jgi:WD40 repeat protein
MIRETNPALTGDYWTLRFSSDGRSLAVASEQVVQLWDVESGQKSKEFSFALDTVRVRLAWLPAASGVFSHSYRFPLA